MHSKLTLLFISLFSAGMILSQVWEQKASSPGVGRHHPVTFSLEGKGYMVTGTTDFSGGTRDFYEYDPVADSWATLPDFPGTARGFSIGDTWNEKAYIGFGLGTGSVYLNDLWEFDAATSNWTQLASCPCAARTHPSFVIENGLLFVGLGNNATNGNLNDWWEYNIAANTWRQLPNLPGLPRHHPYMFSSNGDVFTGLGHGNGPGTNVYNDWYKWEISSETWIQMNNLPAEGRVAGTQLSIGDRGFVLSGDGDNHGAMPTGEFWEYNYQTDTWVSLPPHPGPSRWAPGSFAIGNVVYFIAGEVRPGNPNPGLKFDLWSFDLDGLLSLNSENKLSELTLYPNPATSTIHITGIGAEEISAIHIVNSTGQTVLTQKYLGNGIDVSSLNSGLYFLTVNQNDSSAQRIKFIKQ